MNTRKLQISFFVGLLLIVLGLAFAIFLPFLAPVALAFMTAVIVRPVDRWLVKRCGGRRTLAAALSVVFVLVVVLVPLSVVIQQLTTESFSLYFDLQNGGAHRMDAVTTSLVRPIQAIYPDFNPDVNGFVQGLASRLVNNIGSIFSGTASFGIGVFLWIISFFYMLRDGARFKRVLIELSPLDDTYDEQIIIRLEKTVNAVVRGTFLIAIIQAVLVGIGFWIFGVPNPVLWGSVAAVAAFLPAIGMALVIVPAIVYLILIGSVPAAVGLMVWGIFITGVVDNLLLPRLMRKGFTVHQIFVLFSILGGVSFFGPVGVLLGPLVIALLFALIEIYRVAKF